MLEYCVKRIPSYLRGSVDVYVTSECILLCILCIVTQCLIQNVSIMYLSHVVMPRCSDQEDLYVNKSCQVIVGNPPIDQGLKSP